MNRPAVASDAPLVLVHSDEYANWVFDTQHPTQGRRFMKARERLFALALEAGVTVREVESDLLPGPANLELVHDPGYVHDVLVAGRSNEWSGPRPDLGVLASRMAGGSLVALEELLTGRALTAVNFAGAKHHAQRDRSSGFCVFADFALAARTAVTRGRRVAILDIDAHHGDGTENLLGDVDEVLTFSAHDRTIFPGTGREDDAPRHVFNEPLAAGSGDDELLAGVERFIALATDFGADVVLIAMGADGHATDPLSTLQYSVEGMVAAVRTVRRAFPEMPILLGGAGGYQPDDVTPEVWARMALAAGARPLASVQSQAQSSVRSP
jgi:acetoin utilization deacetylase AcuC-like enzyme